MFFGNGKKLNNLFRDAFASLSCRASKMSHSFSESNNVTFTDTVMAVSVFLTLVFVLRAICVISVIIGISIISIILITACIPHESKAQSYVM